eukprot:g36426.t1
MSSDLVNQNFNQADNVLQLLRRLVVLKDLDRAVEDRVFPLQGHPRVDVTAKEEPLVGNKESLFSPLPEPTDGHLGQAQEQSHKKACPLVCLSPCWVPGGQNCRAEVQQTFNSSPFKTKTLDINVDIVSTRNMHVNWYPVNSIICRLHGTAACSTLQPRSP